MEYGLDADDIRQIKVVFAANPNVKQVIIFGSRAMGNYKEGSDIDLAISGPLTFNDILDLNTALEQLGLIYKFDLQHLDTIKDPDVLSHIKRVGKQLYP